MDNDRPGRKNYFSLIIGLGFFGYGVFRLFTFYQGAPYSTFRMIIAVGFILLGGWDLYRYFNSRKRP